MSFDGYTPNSYEPSERDLVRALVEIEGFNDHVEVEAFPRKSNTEQIVRFPLLTKALENQDDPSASAEEIVEIARSGKPFLLTDSEDRENEGDLIIPAQFATPEIIAFMACECRGLICLALHEKIARKLGLSLAPRRGKSALGTAFTQSIEARFGVTTGISAHDRATTIAAAIQPHATKDSVSSPGHVFPLIAKKNGVLERPGHTEASVDIARLAGCIPAAVICEVMNRDGTMARRDDLVRFARREGLRIGTIDDLAGYRRKKGN